MIDPYVYFPGDPPVPESLVCLGLLTGLGFGCAGIFLRLASRRDPACTNSVRSALLLAALALACAGMFAIPVYRRSGGDWAGLKRTIQIQEADLVRFRAAHPKLSGEQIVRQFGAEDPGPWEFRFRDAESPVYLFTRIMRDGPHIAVDFGRGGVAVFDTTTMWVTYSD